jgi:hypothetical protein
MARRASTSSDASSSALSDVTILKDDAAGGKPPRRGLRQKARDVISDMGSPPTSRHDAKDGAPTKSYAHLGLMGAAVTAQTSRV